MNILLYAVVIVRFVQAAYTVSREAPSVQVCLTQDVATAEAFSVMFITVDLSAQSEF